MDAATAVLVIAALIGSGGLGSLVLAWMRRPQESDSATVEQAAKIASAAASTVDNLQEEVARKNAEIARLRAQRDALRQQITEERENFQLELGALDDKLAQLLIEKHQLELRLKREESDER